MTKHKKREEKKAKAMFIEFSKEDFLKLGIALGGNWSDEQVKRMGLTCKVGRHAWNTRVETCQGSTSNLLDSLCPLRQYGDYVVSVYRLLLSSCDPL